jgi:hypothetical protein
MRRLLALVISSVAIAVGGSAVLAQPAGAALVVYVTNAFNDRVDVYDETGATLGSFGSGLLNDPFGVSVGPDGTVWVADTGNNAIKAFNPAGVLIETITGGLFVAPTDVVVGNDGTLYVSYGGSDAVVTYDADGQFQSSFPTGPTSAPRSVDLGPEGNLYVSFVGDSGNFSAPPGPNDRVGVFAPGGTLLRNIGTGGTGPDQLNNPVGVAFTRDGNVIVGDRDNNTVKIFDAAGNIRGQSGSIGIGDGQFLFMFGLTGTENELFVADSFNDRIQVLRINDDGTLTFDRKWPSNFPTNVAIVSLTPPPPTGRIVGIKFEDVDGDAKFDFDKGDRKLGGWQVYLDLNDNGELDAGEPVQFVSDAPLPPGDFVFEGLPPGDYVVRELPREGWVLMQGIRVTVSSGSNTRVELANVRPGSVKGTVFEDGNADGVRGPGEPGLQNWQAFLDLNGNGMLDSLEPSAMTDAEGGYTLGELGPVSGQMTIELQPGFVLTTPPSRPITITSGLKLTQDFGVTAPPGSVLISGTKFEDVNGDGKQDAGEFGLPGWTIFVDRDGNGALSDTDPKVVTDANGNFAFTPAPPGTFPIREVAQPGWQQTTESVDLTLDPGATADVKIGNFKDGTVEGTAFADGNRDGSRDPGEQGLPDLNVFLDLNQDGVRDAEDPAATTRADGGYVLGGLGPVSGLIRLDLQPGLTQTTPPVLVDVTSGLMKTQDLGVAGQANGGIVGVKFEDLDKDGHGQEGEPLLEDVQLFLDDNGNGVLDVGEAEATTDGAGRFGFGNLAPGTHTLAEVPRVGWQPLEPREITVSPGAPTFVEVPNVRVVQGRLEAFAFTDFDGDGEQDAGDAGLAGTQVFLDSNNNGVRNDGEPSGLTNDGGNFTFEGLAAGTYYARISAFPSTDYLLTVTNPPQVEISAENQTASVRFGAFQLGQASGMLFDDRDGNNVRGPAESGLVNWSVLLDRNGNGTFDPDEAMTATDSNGSFQFTGLRAGPAALVVQTQSGWEPSDADILRFDVTSGTALAHDFGFVQRLAIAGLDAVVLGPHDVKLTFTTNRDATAAVRFGTPERTSPEGTPPATNHVVVLSGLEPQTSYVMEVFVEGEDGLTATASATAETAQLGDFAATLVTTVVTGVVGTSFTANPATQTTKLTDTQRFVAEVYFDVLGRTPDPAAVGFWAGALAGGTRADVAQGLQQTAEFRTALVRGYYTRFLGRAATPEELSARIASLEAGASQERVTAEILGTAEYLARAGDTTAWVTQVYRDALGREPTSGEAGALLGGLSAGQSREAAALELLTSREALTNVVRNAYLRYLAREPDAGAVDFFVKVLQAGSSDEEVAAAVIGSSEYVARLAASDDVVARAGAATIETDGRTVTGALERTGVNTFKVTATLVYDAPGTYDVGLTVFDGANVATGATTAEIRPDLGVSLTQDATDPTKTELRVVGTSADDTIALDRPGGAAIRVVLNGVSAGLFSPTGRIVVDALAGNDTVNVSSTISRRSWVDGGSGADVVNAASSGGNVLLGGDGNDRLSGGAGRDLLIGGSGVDVLGGSGGDDILIGGPTTLDADTGALNAILAEWSSGHSYAQKISNLTGLTSGGLNGAHVLVPGTTVLNDSDEDELRGARARDWFLAAGNDFTDAGSGEIVTTVP